MLQKQFLRFARRRDSNDVSFQHVAENALYPQNVTNLLTAWLGEPHRQVINAVADFMETSCAGGTSELDSFVVVNVL